MDRSARPVGAHPRPPLTPPPGAGFAHRLNRSDVWTDRLGGVHQITEMSDAYLWAVLGYLRWFAPRIRDLVVEEAPAEGVPLLMWLTTQVLWGAIACELVRRGEIAHPAEALQRLLASGSVPWETDDRAYSGTPPVTPNIARHPQ